MRNTLALTKRVLLQFKHDPRTVVMFVVAPLVVLWLLSTILSSPTYEPKLALVEIPEGLSVALQDNDARVESLDSVAATKALADGEVDGIVRLEGTALQVVVDGADASKTQAAKMVVQASVQDFAGQQRDEMVQNLEDTLAKLPAGMTPPIDLDDTITVQSVDFTQLHGSDDWRQFDYFGPVLIGIFVFVFVFITSGMSLINERTGGTMDRLLVTPIQPWQLVLGYSLGYGIVALVQSAVVLGGAIWLIGFPNEGSLLTMVAVTSSLALVSLTLGLVVSGAAKTPLQVIQLMLLTVIPQILLSGIFDLDAAPQWLRVLSSWLPLTHGAEALRAVMLRGATFVEVLPQFLILWGFIAAFFLLATLGFRSRQRR